MNGDTETEPREDFYVRLLNPTSLHTIADAGGVGTITNDDASLSTGNATVTEGNSGTSLATFTVTRAGDASEAASVRWFTLPGTATAGRFRRRRPRHARLRRRRDVQDGVGDDQRRYRGGGE